MLGAEFVAHRFANIGVHIFGGDGADAVAIVILEEILAGQVLKPADERRQAAVADRHLTLGAAFGDVFEAERLAREFGMALAQRRCAEAFVRRDILLVADAERGEVEQADDRCDDALGTERSAVQVIDEARA